MFQELLPCQAIKSFYISMDALIALFSSQILIFDFVTHWPIGTIFLKKTTIITGEQNLDENKKHKYQNTVFSLQDSEKKWISLTLNFNTILILVFT